MKFEDSNRIPTFEEFESAVKQANQKIFSLDISPENVKEKTDAQICRFEFEVDKICTYVQSKNPKDIPGALPSVDSSRVEELDKQYQIILNLSEILKRELDRRIQEYQPPAEIMEEIRLMRKSMWKEQDHVKYDKMSKEYTDLLRSDVRYLIAAKIIQVEDNVVDFQRESEMKKVKKKFVGDYFRKLAGLSPLFLNV